MNESQYGSAGETRRGRAANLWKGGVLCACALVLEGTALALPDNMSDRELVEALSSGSTRERAEACDRLGDRRHVQALSQIAQAAEKDGSARVREACTEALAELGGPESAAVLRRIAASDSEDEVRLEALDGLEEIGTEAADAPAVAQILTSGASARVRKEAADLLGDRRWQAGIPALAEVTRSNSAPIELRRECLEALFKMGAPQADAVVYETLLRSDSVKMRRKAASLIEDRPTASAFQPLCQALSDPDKEVAEDAVEGLLKLGNRDAAPKLREAAQKRGGWLAKKMNEAADRLSR